jgi:hypothetical protein
VSNPAGGQEERIDLGIRIKTFGVSLASMDSGLPSTLDLFAIVKPTVEAGGQHMGDWLPPRRL